MKKFFEAVLELMKDNQFKMDWITEDICILMRGTSHPMAYSRKN